VHSLKGDKSDARYCAARLSADGKHLLAGYHTRLRVWDVASGEMLQALTSDHPVRESWGSFRASDISADGQVAAAIDREHRVYLWEVATGRLLHRQAGAASASNRQMAVSPDNQILAAIDGEGLLRCWN